MKKTLLFIHGFRGNKLGLMELASEFPKKNYDVHLINIPPAGGKTLPEYSARHYARFVGNYIKKNKLDRPILIGHSMGSLVASAVAERYPELIADQLVLLAPISAKPSPFFAMLTPLSALLPNKLVGFITTKYLFIPKDETLLRQTLATTYECGADFTKKSDIYKAAKFSVSCAISDFVFKKNTLMLSGEHDKLIPRKKTIIAAEKIGAKAVFINNAGHLLNYEQPEKTAAAIKDFLKSSSSKSTSKPSKK